MEQEIMVEGMKCEGCANSVKEKFESIEGVEEVSMDLDNKKAVVVSQSEVDTATFASTLSDTKYTVVE